MANIQVRCTLRSANSVIADNCVNTFAVSGATPGTDDADIASCFDIFYNGISAGAPFGLSAYINDTILRVDGLMVELIDDPTTAPNPPYYTELFDLLPVASATPIVQEACIVLSFVDEVYLTSPNPGRHRGRIYFGPLNSAASMDSGTNGVARPHDNAVEALNDNAMAMGTALQTAGAAWTIWSRADDFFYAVSRGWVDNEFDTQRRRGRTWTARAGFGTL